MRTSQIHEGNLIICTAEDASKYSNITKVTDYLSINASAKLDALKSVGGNLYIYDSAKLDALKSVGGDLSIYDFAKLNAPTESVGGDLYIYDFAKLNAPKLESVGGDLYINASAKLNAPKLESVGGDLYINAGAELIANKLYAHGYSKFKVYDNIGCVVLSTKKKDGMTILCCRHSTIRNQKIVGDKFYVAQKDGHNAHAKTISEAIAEIQFKTGERDISQYQNMTMDTKKTPEEWAFVYRMITGACQFGIKDFMEGKGKLKKQYTLQEIIDETNGAWGYDKFKERVAA